MQPHQAMALAGQMGFLSPGISNPTFPTTNSGSSGTSLTLSNIFNTGASLASQIISAVGKNPNTQITNQNGTVSAIQNPSPYGSAGQTNLGGNSLQTTGGVGQQAVQTGASFFDGLASSFGISTSTLMLLGIGGAFLLFRQPPSSRR